MVKVRVYELAKDLNMTNRALLNKMKELKIEVKSHMSSLENGAVAAIKKSLFGKKKQTDDVKVKPSVIRRRRPSHEEEFDDESPNELAGELAGDTVDDVTEQVTPAKAEVSAKEIPKVQSEETPEEQSDKNEGEGVIEPGGAESKKKIVKPKVKKSKPAKIVKPISPDPETPPEPVMEKAVEPVITDDKGAVKKGEDTLSADTKDSKIKKDVPEDLKAEDSTAEDAAVEISLPGPVDEKTDEGSAEKESPEPTESKEAVSKDATAEDAKEEDKKKKKKRKSTPAKIVKIADPAVLENLRKLKSPEEKKRPGVRGDARPGNADKRPAQQKPASQRPAQQRPASQRPTQQRPAASNRPGAVAGAPGPNMTVPPPSDPSLRKKDRRRELPPVSEFAGKRKKRKQKSVVEGDALYTGRGRKKRGKKEFRGGKKGNFQKTQITTPKAIKRRIKVDEAIELSELAKRMGIKANEMIVKLMGMGVMATVNQTIDFETATLVATEFDFEVEKANSHEEDLLEIKTAEDAAEDLIESPPVVTIMGHVDHGKTSLLDVIRTSKITSGEAGGITQHIGAYNVESPNGGRITFLDTPGHAAFTAMRSRGARVTDIVILVVAADDGVMPQTIEAINHSKAAGVPVIVAVNKMDKVGADPDRIMRELSELDLLAEEWGGTVIFVKVSAKTGEGIDELLEMVLLQSEVLELKANPNRKATGYVVESRLDVGRGSVATVLVKQGTLKDGDPIVCGLHSGRIRAMIDDSGERIDAAGPSTPVEIVGLTGVPDAGDEFTAVDSDKEAKQIASHRMQKQRAKELAKKSRVNLEKMFENLGSAEVKELKLIVKADVHGSIEALNDSLKDLAKEEVDIKIVHSGAGTINESDVALAAVSDAIIIGFNVRPSPQIRKMAKDENVDMRFYDIIYNVINDIKVALDGMMPSTFHEIIIGQAEVRETFVVPKMGTIAGSHIMEGKMVRGKKVRLLRDGIIKCDTELSSLRRFKDDVKEVDQGFECGIGLQKYNDIKIGDSIECYEVEERKYKG
ncbi:MAG: translation initiation factor IF-2 [Deltaproteobacteria bacterium]|nr:MAG: translation initiation factor IF-2 [Deltaproteobacteria bacterium]